MDIKNNTSKHINKKRDSRDSKDVAGPPERDDAFGPRGTPRPRGLFPSSERTISGESSENEGSDDEYSSQSDGPGHLRRQNYDSGTESSDSDVGYQPPKKKKGRGGSHHKAYSSSDSDSDSSQQKEPNRKDGKNNQGYSVKTRR